MMSLDGYETLKKLLMEQTLEYRTVWEEVVYAWMEHMGHSPALLSQLIQQEAGWNQLGIQLDWFRTSVSPNIQVTGILFQLPLGDCLTFFQTYEREATRRASDWHEVSQMLYDSYRPKAGFNDLSP